MPYSKQTWTDWAGDPLLAPTTAKFNATRGNYIETGIFNAQATADAALSAAVTDPEVVRDTMALALVAGANVTITPDDLANQIVIASTGGGGTGGGSAMPARKDPATGFWPTSYNPVTGAPVYTGGATNTGRRPTTDPLVLVLWIGPDPSPALVTSGDGGELAGSDVRLVTP